MPNYFIQNENKSKTDYFNSKLNRHKAYIKEVQEQDKTTDSIVSNSKEIKTLEKESQKKIGALKNNSAYKKVQEILSTAKTYLGTPYRYGGTTRRGIDCSALVQKSFGVKQILLPRTSEQQSKTGRPIYKFRLRKGDLVFFATQGRRRVSHVGIITIADGPSSSFIHVSYSKGVMVSKLNNTYWKKRYMGARRIIENNSY